MKIGRIKFKVKDFRTDDQEAEENSPVKLKEIDPVDYPDSCEEAVEIDCGIVNEENVQCRFCWSSD